MRDWILRLLPLLVMLAMPAEARVLLIQIAHAENDLAALDNVRVRLDWPKNAIAGDLRIEVNRFEASDLGYRFDNIQWRCALSRDADNAWHCDGLVRAGDHAPFRLAINLGQRKTFVRLAQKASRFDVRRDTETPDQTLIDLTQIPLVWAQAFLSNIWQDGRLNSGVMNGRFTIDTPPNDSLRIQGDLRLKNAALDTPDASTAAEQLTAQLHVQYRLIEDARLLSVAGAVTGGEILTGTTYFSLPQTPIQIGVDAIQRSGEGWRFPNFYWRDGATLSIQGQAQLFQEGILDELQAKISSANLSPIAARYLSGNLAAYGLSDIELSGSADADLRLESGNLSSFKTRLNNVSIDDPNARFIFEALEGELKFSNAERTDSELRWRSGKLYGIDFGNAALQLRSEDGEVSLRNPVSLAMLGGALRFDNFKLKPAAAERSTQIEFGIALDRMELGALANALDWPAFRGTLSGAIPNARYVDDRLIFDGGIAMQVFDGEIAISSLSMERPFGVAPTLSADVAIENLDLFAVTEVFDFGSITGRMDGRIDDLRLVDWTAVAFDAAFETDRREANRYGTKQRISQRAVQNISSVGDASFVTSLQGQLIGLFDDFGYANIGIACRLTNQVCSMSGLNGAQATAVVQGGSDRNGFTIVAGSGLPRLSVVGYNRIVDWPTLVERLAAVSKGDVKPVVN